MSVLLAVVVTFLLAFAVRLAPGLRWASRGMDAGAHLLLRRHIREHGFRLTMRDWPLVLDECHSYPWVYHWLIALLPDAWLRRLPPLPSAIVDAAHGGFVALVAASVSANSLPAVNAGIVAMVAGLLFVTAPALLVVGIGPRAFEVTPRPLGELFYSLVMVGGWLGVVQGHLAGWALAVVAGAALLLTSKFAAQVLVFCVPLMAAFTGRLELLLVVPASVLAALVVSGGAYWRILRTQCAHLAQYRRRLQFDHPALANRNQGRNLLRAVGRAVRAPRDAKARENVARLAEGHTLLQFLLRNVLWCGVALLWFGGAFRSVAMVPSTERWMLVWAFAPIGPFLLSSLRSFRFLGEAERYPEFGVAPTAILGAVAFSAYAGAGRWLLLGAYVLMLLPPFIYTIARMRWTRNWVATGDLANLTEWMRRLPRNGVVLPLPIQLAYQIVSEVNLRFVAGMDAGVWARDYDSIFASYPWLHPDLERWRGLYGVSTVVVDREALRKDQAPDYHLDLLQRIAAFGRFEVYSWPAEAD